QATALLVMARTEEALALLRDLATSVDRGDPDLTLSVDEVIAHAASMTGDHRRAVRLAALDGAQRALHTLPLDDLDRGFLERQRATPRAALGEAVDEVEAEGRSLTVAEALGEAALVTAT